jgi:ATP-dependent helicase HrpB
MAPLPIDTVSASLRTVLARHPAAVVQAPPGAGKTTGVPLALLGEPWLKGQRIVMLEPRRLAARAAALRMAELLHEPVGQTVGYRVRMDSRVGPATRIEAVTEGVFTRMLQSDPGLSGVGLVIFDEYHERSLEADLALALCRDVQGVLNDALRLLVMSATLETERVAELLGRAPVLTCSGRSFPVETIYRGRRAEEAIEAAVAAAVCRMAAEGHGSILVFLPGAPEIRRVARRLHAAALDAAWQVTPLCGNLSFEMQKRAILPAPAGRHKIVLATAIAETSLTIEGIRVVIDSGLSRVPRFDVGSGLTRLVTLPVTRASADQRRGRAGRMMPGICVRLWSREQQAGLVPHTRPAILEADLAPLGLELALWGVRDAAALHWIDPPPSAALQQARALLTDLGALTSDGGITDHGRRMAELPLHPRLAHMLLMALSSGAGAAACDLAALLSERDIIRFAPGTYDADLDLRLDVLARYRREGRLHTAVGSADREACRRVARVAEDLHRRLAVEVPAPGHRQTGMLLAWAYPDRIARRRPGAVGRFLLSNGRGAFMDPGQPLAAADTLVAATLDGDRRDARIFLAAVIAAEELHDRLGERMAWVERVDWDDARQAVIAERSLNLGALTFKREALSDVDPAALEAAFIKGILRTGLDSLPWTTALRSWQARVMFLHRVMGADQGWPDVSDERLGETLREWLGPFLSGYTRLKELTSADLAAALKSLLPWPLPQQLDRLAPTHLVVPSGSRRPIDYTGETPVLAVRLQEMFGARATPVIADGRQPLLIHLLSPAGRPTQITQDLPGFWKYGYPMVKKELKGRYPKHYWPEDPLAAAPTARVRPRRGTGGG